MGARTVATGANGNVIRLPSGKVYRRPTSFKVEIADLELDDYQCYSLGTGGEYIRYPTPTLNGTWKISTTPPFLPEITGNCEWLLDQFESCYVKAYEFLMGIVNAGGSDGGYNPAYLYIRLTTSARSNDWTIDVQVVHGNRGVTRYQRPLFYQTKTIACADYGSMVFDASIYTDFAHERGGFTGSPGCLVPPGVVNPDYEVNGSGGNFGKNGTITVTPCYDDGDDCGLANVISVESTCSATIIINFSAPILLDDFGTKLAFSITPAIGGGPYYLSTGTGVQVTPTQVEFDVSGWNTVPGDTWNVTAQLEWTRGRVNSFPLTGTVGGSPCPPTILSVVTDGSTNVLVTFDQPISLQTGSSGDSSFDVDGDFYQGISSQPTSNSGIFVMGVNHGSGETWTLNTTTPSWALSPATVNSGTGTTV